MATKEEGTQPHGRLPNLVIAGAPKCGTSTLFSWLADHPDVCASRVKETFFLVDSGTPLSNGSTTIHDTGISGYQSLFSHCRSDIKLVIEGTTHYLYQETARTVLSTLDPVPHIVFLLRNPADRAYSSFRYTRDTLRRLRRNISFAKWLRLLETRPAEAYRLVIGERSSYVLVNDVQFGRYIEYLRPWISAFGSDRIHVYLFEHFVRAPRYFMEGLAELASIDPTFYRQYEFQRANRTVRTRSRALQRAALAARQRIPDTISTGMLETFYRRFQTTLVPQEVSDEDHAALARLEQQYARFNTLLGTELGIDVNAWRTRV